MSRNGINPGIFTPEVGAAVGLWRLALMRRSTSEEADDDKPNFIQADATVVIAAYVRKAERLSHMCAAGPRYECHRPVMKGPAQVATFNDGTTVEQYWEGGVRKLKRELRPTNRLARVAGAFAPVAL